MKKRSIGAADISSDRKSPQGILQPLREALCDLVPQYCKVVPVLSAHAHVALSLRVFEPRKLQGEGKRSNVTEKTDAEAGKGIGSGGRS